RGVRSRPHLRCDALAKRVDRARHHDAHGLEWRHRPVLRLNDVGLTSVAITTGSGAKPAGTRSLWTCPPARGFGAVSRSAYYRCRAGPFGVKRTSTRAQNRIYTS